MASGYGLAAQGLATIANAAQRWGEHSYQQQQNAQTLAALQNMAPTLGLPQMDPAQLQALMKAGVLPQVMAAQKRQQQLQAWQTLHGGGGVPPSPTTGVQPGGAPSSPPVAGPAPAPQAAPAPADPWAPRTDDLNAMVTAGMMDPAAAFRERFERQRSLSATREALKGTGIDPAKAAAMARDGMNVDQIVSTAMTGPVEYVQTTVEDSMGNKRQVWRVKPGTGQVRPEFRAEEVSGPAGTGAEVSVSAPSGVPGVQQQAGEGVIVERGPLSAFPTQERLDSLRKRFTDASKDFSFIQQRAALVESALETLSDPTASPARRATAINEMTRFYEHILEPGAIVREGDIRTREMLMALAQQMRLRMDRISDPTAPISPEMAQELGRMAYKAYDVAAQSMEGHEEDAAQLVDVHPAGRKWGPVAYPRLYSRSGERQGSMVNTELRERLKGRFEGPGAPNMTPAPASSGTTPSGRRWRVR